MKLSRTARLLVHTCNLVVIAFILLPLIAAVSASLQSEVTMRSDLRSILPPEVTWDNFKILLSAGSPESTIYSGVAYLPDSLKHFGTALFNSLVIALSVAAITLACGSLSAYAIARLHLRWLNWFLGVNVLARFVPLVVLVIPLYVTFRQIGLVNSLSGVVIAQAGVLLPFGILILLPYFAAVPQEIEEAARLDGCSRFQAFLRVALPLTRPSLVSLGAIVFIASWNDLLIPLILNNRPEFMTVPVVLVSLIGDSAVFFGLLCACCIVAMLPTVVLVALLQKNIVEGLTAGAVKA